ncbi:molybdopterin-dependent oxidoreductase [Proteiniborus sp.]|uniref:molybdopterin-dependent oxidoreductase n=1 Tax=Proteiniborus sp. TaxID=2079015 RepID=UPI0033169250
MFTRKKQVTIIISIFLIFLLTACSNSETPSVGNENLGEDSQVEQPVKQVGEVSEAEQEEFESEVSKDTEENEEVANEEDKDKTDDQSESKADANKDDEQKSQLDIKSEPEKENNTEPNDSEQSTNSIVDSGIDEEDTVDKVVLELSGTGVDNPIKLSLDEIKRMTDYYYEDDFFSLNSFGTTEYFSFKGIRMKGLLEKVKIKESATTVKFIASDGYEIELTIEDVLKEDYIDEQDPSKKYPVIIAWHENGKDYDEARGLPFRLVIGQIEPGDVNKPQWVQNIAKIIID